MKSETIKFIALLLHVASLTLWISLVMFNMIPRDLIAGFFIGYSAAIILNLITRR